MLYDILIFNNSTKKDYLFQGQEDTSNNPLCHTFENLDLSGLPSGEYTCYTIRNDYGTAVTWDIKDVPLNSVLTYEGKEFKLAALLPEISLLKLGVEETIDKSVYKAKNEEYAYRKRK